MLAFEIWRSLAAAGLLMGLTSVSPGGQQDEQVNVCQGVDGTYGDLDTQIEALRVEIRKLDAEGAATETLASMRTRLGDLIFSQDCLRPDMQADPVRDSASEINWVTVNTYYATNRKPGEFSETIAHYTGERERAGIRFGRATVSIPTRRQPGELNLPRNLWLFELPSNPGKHFIIKAVTPLSPNGALGEMRTRIEQLPRKSVLIFVHGYNVSFHVAALRTAQLAHDLDFPGLPLFFSWPSAGTTSGYPHDAEMSELSLDAFNTLLNHVGRLRASEVFIVAHSMGNRVVTRALTQRLAAGKRIPPNLKGLLLAAPDINADIFREQIAPRLASISGTSKTIYASNNDVALRASSILHDFARVGLAAPSVQTFDGWDTVDASNAAPLRRAWGHSYVVDSPKVLRDMQVIIYQHRSAPARGLAKRGTPPKTWWALD
jgi:esterase/lipase superfamily enzyme